MRNLEEIHNYVEVSTLILVINNNSRSLLDSFYNLIYKKYPYKKSAVKSSKGLMKKISMTKDKLIKIDIDFKKLQFSSSNTSSKLWEDFLTIKACVIDNKSKILFKANQNYKNIEQFSIIFDLIIMINKTSIKLVRTPDRYWNYGDDNLFSIDKLTRSTKLKQLNKLNF